MAVVHRHLPGVIGHRYWQLPTGVVTAQQHIADGLGASFRRAPALQNGGAALVRDIAGNGAAVQVQGQQRLAQSRRLADEAFLAGGQVDGRGVHPLAHGGNGAGAVLAAQGQDGHIGLPNLGEGFLIPGGFLARYGITVGIEDLGFRQPVPQLLEQAFAAGFLAPQHSLNLRRFIRLDLGAGDKPHAGAIGPFLLHPGDGGSHRVGGLRHGHVGVAAEELVGVVRLGADEGNGQPLF